MLFYSTWSFVVIRILYSYISVIKTICIFIREQSKLLLLLYDTTQCLHSVDYNKLTEIYYDPQWTLHLFSRWKNKHNFVLCGVYLDATNKKIHWLKFTESHMKTHEPLLSCWRKYVPGKSLQLAFYSKVFLCYGILFKKLHWI